MKTSRISILALAVVLLLPACHPEIEFVENSFRSSYAEGTLSGGNLNVVFSSSAGSASVGLEATGKWSASFVNDRAKDWCSLSLSDGKRGTATIMISVYENPDYDERSASINFVCGEVRRTIIVTQKQKDALLLSSGRQDMGMDGGRFTVEVKANVPYEYAISKGAASWLTQVGTKGLSTSVLTFNVAANESFDKREGEITFTSSVGTEVVKVYQESDTPTLIVSGNSREMTAEAGRFSVDVRSNVDVSFEIPSDCGWIHAVETKSMSTNTFVFSVDENEGFVDRTARIAFKSAGWKLEEAVVVSQQAATPVIIIGSGAYEFEPEGGDLSIDVTSNFGVKVQVPDSCAWIKAIPTKSLTTMTFQFMVEVNDTFAPREGVIIFRNDDLGKEEIVQVLQKAEDPMLVIGQHQYDYAAEGGVLSVELSSNLSLDVVIQAGCDWIVPLETKAVTERTHTFSVNKNHSRYGRSAWIVFRNERQARADTIHVSQSFQPILVPVDTLKASSRGWTVSFETVSPVADDYKLSFADNWASQSGQERLPEGTRFLVDVQAQRGNAKPRDTRILVYYQDFEEPDTVWIRQYEKFPSFSYTTTSKTVTIPAIEGDNQVGFVFWDDGTQELWQEGLTHTYKTGGSHTVSVEIRSKKRVSFSGLEDGMTINLKDLRK